MATTWLRNPVVVNANHEKAGAFLLVPKLELQSH